MFTTTARKRHRSISSSSPEDSPYQQSTEPSSADPTRSCSRSISPRGGQPDSDFESLPEHLVTAGPSRKRRRKNGDDSVKHEGRKRHVRPEPFIRTGFESMALESDGEDGYPPQNGQFPPPGYPVFGEQQEEFVDDSPGIASKDFAFQHNMNSTLYDTYRTRDAAEPDMQGDSVVMDEADVVQPQSVEMPTADQEFPMREARRTVAKEPSMADTADVMVEDETDPEAGGRSRTKVRGKNWYEPEKDRIIVTSLSDTESEPTSPEPTTPPIDLSTTTDEIIELPPADRLTQPGSRGFTIHPTLLNRLNRMSEEERSRLPFIPGKYNQTEERGLILYRTPGRTFGGVRKNGGMESDDEDEDDADRFQVLPDDDGDGDMEMMVEQEQEQDDGVAGMSDVEVDQSGIMEDVDSMDIG